MSGDALFAPTSSDLRIVIQWTTGPWTGLRQIHGTVSQLKAASGSEKLPALSAPFQFLDGHTGIAGFSAVKQRYVLYKEISGLDALEQFSKEQH